MTAELYELNNLPVAQCQNCGNQAWYAVVEDAQFGEELGFEHITCIECMECGYRVRKQNNLTEE